MTTAKEYRLQAEQCSRLAEETTEVFVRTTLMDRAKELNELADRLEQGKSPDQQKG
jgi:hypothetical protein